MNAHDAPVPDIVLERYRLNELPDPQAAAISARLAGDARLRARLDALRESDEEMRRDGTVDRLAAAVQRRALPSPARGGPWLASPFAAGRVALLILLVLMPLLIARRAPLAPPSNEAGSPSTDRIKGLTPSLAVFRRTSDGSETLADGATAHAGDVVRVGYRAAGKSFGTILSIDGRGSVTVHMPPSGERAAPLRRDAATVLLDQAYELDDAPREERFYFVAGDAPFDLAPVLAAARRAGADRQTPARLALPSGLEQATFSLHKEARP